MTISKMTQRSNRLDARIDKLIEAQERFVAALTEALAQFVQPVHMASATTLPDLRDAQPGAATYHPTAGTGATLHHRDVTRSAQPEDAERRVPRTVPLIDMMDEAVRRPVPYEGLPSVEDRGGYDPSAFFDMAAELAGDIEDDEALPRPDEDGVWRKRLHLNALRLWQPDWGPRPGQAGCLVPAHLLNGRG